MSTFKNIIILGCICLFNLANNSFAQSYCALENLQNSPILGEYISKVQINSLLNDSSSPGSTPKIYENFTNKVAQVSAGKNFLLEVSPYNGGNNWLLNYGAWIDYNFDGVFSDNESVVSMNLVQGTLQRTVFIPPTTRTGMTRIRLSLRFADPAIHCPAELDIWGRPQRYLNSYMGQIEDYSLMILPTSLVGGI